MNSVQQLLEDEAPEWAGPADPVVQSSQWGFSCPGRWADAVAEDVYAPETAWFEPQRSSSVGHAVEPKQRSRRRSKRHKQTAPEHTGPLGGESTESTIRVLQLEQLLMLDERIPSFQEPTPAPVGKQPRRATSQPPMSAKAKPQSRPRPQRDPKAKARAPLHTQSQRRPSKQSLQSQPETQRKEAQRRPGNPKASKADGWRSGQESEWSRHVTHARSPEGPNPEAVPQGLAALAPEHVGQERPQARLNSEARGSRSHPIRNQVTDSRRRPRSRPKMPTSSALPQRSGRAWRAGRRSSESDPAPGPVTAGHGEERVSCTSRTVAFCRLFYLCHHAMSGLLQRLGRQQGCWMRVPVAQRRRPGPEGGIRIEASPTCSLQCHH